MGGWVSPCYQIPSFILIVVVVLRFAFCLFFFYPSHGTFIFRKMQRIISKKTWVLRFFKRIMTLKLVASVSPCCDFTGQCWNQDQESQDSMHRGCFVCLQVPPCCAGHRHFNGIWGLVAPPTARGWHDRGRRLELRFAILGMSGWW